MIDRRERIHTGFGKFERVGSGTGTFRSDLSASPSAGASYLRTPDGQLLSERTATGTTTTWATLWAR